jgi:hypothetical protein
MGSNRQHGQQKAIEDRRESGKESGQKGGKEGKKIRSES